MLGFGGFFLPTVVVTGSGAAIYAAASDAKTKNLKSQIAVRREYYDGRTPAVNYIQQSLDLGISPEALTLSCEHAFRTSTKVQADPELPNSLYDFETNKTEIKYRQTIPQKLLQQQGEISIVPKKSRSAKKIKSSNSKRLTSQKQTAQKLENKSSKAPENFASVQDSASNYWDAEILDFPQKSVENPRKFTVSAPSHSSNLPFYDPRAPVARFEQSLGGIALIIVGWGIAVGGVSAIINRIFNGQWVETPTLSELTIIKQFNKNELTFDQSCILLMKNHGYGLSAAKQLLLGKAALGDKPDLEAFLVDLVRKKLSYLLKQKSR